MNKTKKDLTKLYTSIIVWILYIIWILKFSSTSLTITNLFFHILFLVLISVIYYNDLLGYIKKFKTDKKKSVIFWYVLGLFGILFASNFLISFITNLGGLNFDADSSSNVIGSLFAKFPLGTLFASFLTIIFYSIVEELIYRKSIYDVVKNPYLFVIISSLISWYFQATIFSPKLYEFIISLTVLFNSVFLSSIYVKKDNILYTIFPRMIYNFIICIIQFMLLGL